jgi:hypothetical protein
MAVVLDTVHPQKMPATVSRRAKSTKLAADALHVPVG